MHSIGDLCWLLLIIGCSMSNSRVDCFQPSSTIASRSFRLFLNDQIENDLAKKSLNLIPRSHLTSAKRVSGAALLFCSSAIVAANHVNAMTNGDLENAAEFRIKFPYRNSEDFLNYIYSVVPAGDVGRMLSAFDEFAAVYPMYKLTPLKASLIDRVIKQQKPSNLLEIGSFFGYSAIHLLAGSSPTSQVTCIEGNEENVAVIKAVLLRAFAANKQVLDRIHIIPGLSTTSIKAMPTEPAFDFIFLDHDKSFYLPDIQLLESRGLVSANCTMVADNVIFPGAPDFLNYVSSEGGAWSTMVEKMPFERKGFETKYQEREDGMSISRRIAQLNQ